MADMVRDAGLAALRFARKTTLSLLEEFPHDKLLFQPMPGANHALWIAGHLAWTDDFFLSTFAARESSIPPAWTGLFAQGSIPGTNPEDYPSFNEVLTELASQREAFVGWFSAMSDEELAKPMPEDWQTFAPTMAAFMSSAACHEAMHAGQLTVLRKSLGLKPKFG